MGGIIQDIRYAIRLLIKSPGFTIVVIAALAAGIGVNTAVFTMVNAVLFKGLPFERPGEIMHLTGVELAKGREDTGVSYPDFTDWRAQTKSFSGLAAFQDFNANLTDPPAAPERYTGARFSANAFALIGQKPMLGRDFLPSEDQPNAPPVVILGYKVWKNRYGSDPQILGRTIRLNSIATTVIGVMPEGMRFPRDQDLWTPLVPVKDLLKREERSTAVFGRLNTGVSLAAARAEMDLIAKQLEKEYSATNKGIGILIRPYNVVFSGGKVRTVFLAMLGAVGFVLLIACANVANLQLARATARLREVSIRTALGASRWRVIRQLLIESILLGIAGGVVGLLIALVGVRAFDLAVANVGKPYWIRFTMDWVVFSYLALVCIGAGIVSGLLPALAASSNVELGAALKEGGRGTAGGLRGRWISGALVVSEYALALVLLVGAGLMIRSFLNAYNNSAGYELDRTLTLRFGIAEDKYKTPESKVALFDRLLNDLRAVPGVERVAITSRLPATGAAGWKVEFEGRPAVEKDRRPAVSGLVVSPQYFQALDIVIERGRDFVASDGQPGKESIIVNRYFAEKYLPGENPTGRRIRIVGEKDGPWASIIGVCGNVMQDQLIEKEPIVYVPYRQEPLSWASIVARTGPPAANLVADFRKQINAIDTDVPIYSSMTLRDFYRRENWPWRVFGSLFAIFAAIALLLSAVGIFSVVAFNVGRRTQEIGVRMALGASTTNILGVVMRSALRQLAAGTVIGLAGALATSRVLKALLVQVTPTDPLTFAAVALILVTVGMLACWIPGRRASRIDPVIALRYE